MTFCLFASDLHGDFGRYRRLFAEVERRRPAVLFLGGDLLPGLAALAGPSSSEGFLEGFLLPGLETLGRRMGEAFPRVFVILGNDDPRAVEPTLLEADQRGLLAYLHRRRRDLYGTAVYGYACVPPTPFLLKDWERYDVSRYVDPGCVSPEEGLLSVPVSDDERRWSTIRAEIDELAGDDDLRDAVFLFHSPPYQTCLDRAALDGRSVDHVPLDVHVGSIAVRRFLEARQPRLSLHGHVHESARLTGSWQDRIGATVLLGAAHDGPELALVGFDLEDPAGARRWLL